MLQNKINFLREELKVKNQLLEFLITSKKSDARNSFQSTTNKRCLINTNRNNNITSSSALRADMEISNTHTHEERTNATKKYRKAKHDCNTQNKTNIDHIKPDLNAENRNQFYCNIQRGYLVFGISALPRNFKNSLNNVESF